MYYNYIDTEGSWNLNDPNFTPNDTKEHQTKLSEHTVVFSTMCVISNIDDPIPENTIKQRKEII